MPWFAVYTQPKNEKKVADRLTQLGLEVYCPMVTQIKQWSDRKKKTESPLIPSYVFVHLEERERNRVFEVPGVVRYLFWLGKPAIIKAAEIAALRDSLKETVSSVAIEGIKAGDHITIAEGPFKDREAVVQETGTQRIKVVLKELGIVVILSR